MQAKHLLISNIWHINFLLNVIQDYLKHIIIIIIHILKIIEKPLNKNLKNALHIMQRLIWEFFILKNMLLLQEDYHTYGETIKFGILKELNDFLFIYSRVFKHQFLNKINN